ncbi:MULTISPECIES: 30S ribosomal protein S9 [Dictyoglomus]|uniref:Small ribosomal subunit protein uS9 n=1 Tax=Dictyoglomus turgidum (strain DSM 6724 / Z-1310) TaxID=515635 RepID=B8E1G7_DICTD|nr:MULTISPECIES: 30S ribosomal protein S9 [Dictyoglomus]ACK42295.1 ribosomal protein S9 [Dictyoglomus turgidum DSM 6724]HBU31974.1 30S ribosomal protein S9 [Dictyoglomus sp.]
MLEFTSQDVKVIHEVGGRKTSRVKVWLRFPGEGKIIVNDKPLEEYFGGRIFFHKIAKKPLELTGMLNQVDVIAQAIGGGVSAQAQALAHGISKALVALKEDWKTLLKKEGLLKRDPREKERKKYGLKRARRAPQYSKR